MSISQELFDETLLENQDLFELSAEEALAETISQFQQQGIDVKEARILTSHPSTVEGKEKRMQISNFMSQLNFLDTFIMEDGAIQNSEGENEILILKALQCIYEGLTCCANSKVDSDPEKNNGGISSICIHTLVRSEGIFTLLSLLSSSSIPILHQSALCLLSTLTQSATSPTNAEFKRQIQVLLSPVLPRLVGLIEVHSKTDHIFLQLAIHANKGCQQNKVAIVRTAKAFPKLLQILSINASQYSEDVLPTNDDILLWMHTCQLLTTLCQYDDITAAASTAHDFAQELFRNGAIPILHKLLSIPTESSQEIKLNSSKLNCAIMTTQRILAVNDEIVQALVAQGVLKTTCDSLSQSLAYEDSFSSSSPDPSFFSKEEAIATASAALGLLRNLCGNDDIKTTLCQNSLPSILSSMSQFIENPKIQEHGLGMLAAMSLRRISNAKLLLQNNVIEIVMRSMQKFPNNEKIQRAGCLCIRNTIARQSDTIKNAIKDDHPLLETVLRSAGKFMGTVDEAYAALRDLDIRVEMLRLQEVEKIDENGVAQKNLFVKKRGVEMFGESKLKFRQTWEESEDVEERIDGLF